MIECYRYKQKFEESEFYNIELTRKSPLCRRCCQDRTRKYRTGHKKEIAIRRKEIRQMNPSTDWAANSYRNHLKKGHIMNITRQELKELVLSTSHCRYCGSELKFGSYNNGAYDHAPTLDRINNDNEIRKDNIQIICHRCNNSKGAMTHIEFINLCKSIASRW